MAGFGRAFPFEVVGLRSLRSTSGLFLAALIYPSSIFLSKIELASCYDLTSKEPVVNSIQKIDPLDAPHYQSSDLPQ